MIQSVTEILTYIQQHFLTRAQTAAACGITESQLDDMIAAKILPGASYWIDDTGVHSGIGHFETTGLKPEKFWPKSLLPDATAWIAQTQNTGKGKAAEQLKLQFCTDFLAALRDIPTARHYGWTDFFDDDGRLKNDAARREAHEDWDTWLGGVYGVCIKQFSARNLVLKISYRGEIRALTAQGTHLPKDPSKRAALNTAMQGLNQIVMGFAPHERPTSTRGLWLDRIEQKLEIDG